ncbi:flagellar protein FlgN [Stappia sp.]|uniref:flagellar protein FlgN n=1 Tax=Stappia sp. TaxID=1870903 RepID=UPI0032D91025
MSLDTKTLSQIAPEFFSGAIADQAAAEAVCNRLAETMAELLKIIEAETELVRAGKLEEAGLLQPEKANLVSVYMRGMTFVRDQTVSLGNLAPASVEDLKRRHAEFQPVLRINLAVLATAREVADNLMRKVAEGAGSRRAPTTYGPGGSAPRAPTPADGIAVNRAL